MIKEMCLKLEGKNGRIIQNTLWCQNEKTSKIAIFFPGFRYPPEAPVFHYLKLHFLHNGWSVLCLDYRYNELDHIETMDDSEFLDYIREDINSIENQIETEFNYNQFCFVGKSLGTTLLYQLLKNDPVFVKRAKCQFVWLTPAESNKKITEYIIENKIPSIYVIGDKDPYYDKVLLSKIKNHILGTCLVLPGAGHLFNEGGDLFKTMDNIKHVIEFLTENIELS